MRSAARLASLLCMPLSVMAQSPGDQVASIDVGQNAKLILERNATDPLLADAVGIIRQPDGSQSVIRAPAIGNANSLDDPPTITPKPNDRYMLGNFGCGACADYSQGANFVVGIRDSAWYVTGFVEERRDPNRTIYMACDINLETGSVMITGNGKVTKSLTDQVPFPLADLSPNFVPKACVFPELRRVIILND
jgi:hypothetical protein